MVIVGNKADLEEERMVGLAEGQALAARHKRPHYETSAKTNYNIDELFHCLGNHRHRAPLR